MIGLRVRSKIRIGTLAAYDAGDLTLAEVALTAGDVRDMTTLALAVSADASVSIRACRLTCLQHVVWRA